MGDALRKPRKDEIEKWQRRKMIYDRHKAGETYPAIAENLGISVPRVTELSDMWKRKLEGYEDYMAHLSEYQQPHPNPFVDRRNRENIALFDRLVASGLLGNGIRSAEYGYA